MMPALVALPTTVIAAGELEELAACVRALGRAATVLVGTHRDAAGHVLDEFVLAAALAALAPSVRLGVAARAGQGRAASVIAREATAAELLGACDVVVLHGDAAACADAAAILAVMFTPGAHTASHGDERVVGARNLPQPSVAGAPRVAWREGAALIELRDGVRTTCGAVLASPVGARWPEAAPGSLLELSAPLGPPRALAASLAR